MIPCIIGGRRRVIEDNNCQYGTCQYGTLTNWHILQGWEGGGSYKGVNRIFQFNR